MDLQALKDSLPEYAKDTKLNLASILVSGDQYGLTAQQVAGTALACAYAIKHPVLIQATQNYAREFLDEAGVNGAKAAATIMAMNNIYYRFTHLVSDHDFAQMPAKLRMNIIGNPGISKMDFELYSLAVSAINACGMCIDAHVKTLQQHNISKESIQHAVRIGSILNAVAQALIIENQ